MVFFSATDTKMVMVFRKNEDCRTDGKCFSEKHPYCFGAKFGCCCLLFTTFTLSAIMLPVGGTLFDRACALSAHLARVFSVG